MLSRFSFCCFLSLLVSTLFAETRVFTDDRGRQVEAELVGVNGANVALKRGETAAQWPVSKLSQADQQYVKAWLARTPGSPPILVNVWEREGISESGQLEEKASGPGIPKNIPFLKATEEKAKYRYYDIDLSNRTQVDARKVFVSYVIYVIGASNRVLDLSGSAEVEWIPAGQKKTVASRSATFVRTKTTSATFGINPLGHLTTGTSTDRSKERFGGIWVRAYGADGELLGERKDLHDELERLDFRFTGSTGKEMRKLPVVDSFEKLRELFEILPKPEGGGPPKPPFLR